jgi:hypothetical protein
MSDTVKAVERLCWLCQEAVVRAEEELGTDFSMSLEPLQREMKDLVRKLIKARVFRHRQKPPFNISAMAFSRDEEGFTRFIELKFLFVVNPFETDKGEPMFIGYTGFIVDPCIQRTTFIEPDEKRKIFCQKMRHWVRFLKAKEEELKAASTAGTSKPETTASVSRLSAEQISQESEDEILKKLFPRPDGLKTAKKVLKYARTGKSQRDIAGQIGKRPSTISEIVKKLRQAGLLPDT